ncbi:hypothetical protein AXW84_03315 [Hymenobacter sp. PAMC 26628]|nr:hypothetical protein AXW84_03315 [Hymenobacter sp. PAMC 26628]
MERLRRWQLGAPAAQPVCRWRRPRIDEAADEANFILGIIKTNLRIGLTAREIMPLIMVRAGGRKKEQ